MSRSPDIEPCLKELASLIGAWQDRGVKAVDAFYVLAVSFAEIVAHNKIAPNVAVEVFSHAYTGWMKYILKRLQS